MPPPTPEQQIEFLNNIQRLLAEGRFVASYKFALLQALADLSVEKGDVSGDALKLSISQIAEKFIQYYWRQTLPFVSSSQKRGGILKQNTGRQAAVVNLLDRARVWSGGSLSKAKMDRQRWARLVNEVANVVQVMPLWKLQTVGQETEDFLYPSTGEGSEIELRPGVAFCMRQFHSLIQDLIQGAWVRYVRSIGTNQRILGETADLREFLFGSERENLNIYRSFLKELQSGACFYCRSRIGGPGEVDHFIPWTRYPVDLGHNFVLADKQCSSSKRDYLAAEQHLESWLVRNDTHLITLNDFFDESGIIHDLESSTQVTFWAYDQAKRSNAHVWVSKDEIRPIGTYWQRLRFQDSIRLLSAADKEDEDTNGEENDG